MADALGRPVVLDVGGESVTQWLKKLLCGQPHFVIGDPADPYLLRWYLIPRNRYINIYLHKFLKDDDDRALHDHPWWFVSLMVWGGYFEHSELERNTWKTFTKHRTAPSIAFRRPTDRHRIELERTPVLNKPIPCWTIVVTGPKSRAWGFWCPKGFVPWFDFVDSTDTGNVGKGCGE